MQNIIAVIALTFNVVLMALMALVLVFGRNDEEITVRYYVAGLIFTLINVIAITTNTL